jgi:hypothetical protein
VADFVFNIAKGRVGEFFKRVDANDPANSALIIVVLATTGLDADSVLIDVDALDTLLSGSPEVTNSGYARKVLADSDVAMPSPDDANDRYDFDIADQTWTAVAAGDGWSKLLVCYDSDTTGGIPCTAHDFVVVPDGSDITAQIAAAGFYRAA